MTPDPSPEMPTARRAIALIFGNRIKLDESGAELWVPTKYDAEAVKSVANTTSLLDTRRDQFVTAFLTANPIFDRPSRAPADAEPKKQLGALPFEVRYRSQSPMASAR